MYYITEFTEIESLHVIPTIIAGFKSSLPSAFVQFDAASSAGEKNIPSSFNANFPASLGGQEFRS